MKVNVAFVKLVTRLLVILIFFVCLFMLSAFLYSARYWKDVYNYLTPNITIKRIPTISELNLTDYDVTTELYYSTTNSDYDFITEDDHDLGFEFRNATSLVTEDESRGKTKIKAFNKRDAEVIENVRDYSELPKPTVVDYFFDFKEYDKTKDTKKRKLAKDASEDVEVFTEINELMHLIETTLDPNGSCHRNVTNIDMSQVIYPWVGTIFVKNGSSDQFDYVCDAAVMTKRSLVTAARCLREMNKTLLPENIIVILGKRSLLSMEGNDAYRIKEVILHDNFKDNGRLVVNDLAILKTEEDIKITPRVETACLFNSTGNTEDIIDSATTGWQVSSEMTTIHFIQKENNTDCVKSSENVICASYGFDVSTCPSFGGLYLVKLASNSWHLRGILTDDTSRRGLCVNRHRQYTDLEKYGDWLKTNL